MIKDFEALLHGLPPKIIVRSGQLYIDEPDISDFREEELLDEPDFDGITDMKGGK